MYQNINGTWSPLKYHREFWPGTHEYLKESALAAKLDFRQLLMSLLFYRG
jgi:hypothetical protein